MKNFRTLIAGSLAILLSLTSSARTNNNVYVIPNATSVPTWSTVNLSSSNAVSGVLPIARGGSGAGTLDQSYELRNVGLSASISSNALVVALKQADGSSNCSASAPCFFGFRNSTATTGGYTQVQVTSSANITLAAADSIGEIASGAFPLYVYMINDSTPEVCLSRSYWDDGTLQSASALTGGADTSSTTLWCTSAHTSKAVRAIGRVSATWSNPNWGSITEVSTNPFLRGANHINGQVDSQTFWAVLQTSSASPTVLSQGGSWVASLTHNGVGDVIVTFSTTTFSAPPSCTALAVSAMRCLASYNNTQTRLTVRIGQVSCGNGVASDDTDTNLTCTGPQ